MSFSWIIFCFSQIKTLNIDRNSLYSVTHEYFIEYREYGLCVNLILFSTNLHSPIFYLCFHKSRLESYIRSGKTTLPASDPNWWFRSSWRYFINFCESFSSNSLGFGLSSDFWGLGFGFVLILFFKRICIILLQMKNYIFQYERIFTCIFFILKLVK